MSPLTIQAIPSYLQYVGFCFAALHIIYLRVDVNNKKREGRDYLKLVVILVIYHDGFARNKFTLY